MNFRYKGYLVEISSYGATGSCTKLFQEYIQKIMCFSFKRKKLLILSANLWHIRSIEPLSNKMAIEFAENAIKKLNKLNEENEIKLDLI